MVFNSTFNNITAISWQFVHKGDIITVNACFWKTLLNTLQIAGEHNIFESNGYSLKKN